jgi:hypothetical protein
MAKLLRDATRIRNPYRASRGRWAEVLAGNKLSRMLGETVVPRRLGSFIYEHFLLKRAGKPPMDPRARDLLLEIYESEIDELERIVGCKMPELRRSWPVEEEPSPVEAPRQRLISRQSSHLWLPAGPHRRCRMKI